MYDTIIVPLDGSDAAARALAPAAVLAAEYDSSVTIVSVVSPSFGPSMTETASSQAAAAGIPYPTINLMVSVRSPVSSLNEALDKQPNGLLCMATTGRSHLGQVVGSVAEELLRIRTGPILLVGPSCKNDAFKPAGKILVPVDGSDTAADILPIAASWAIAYQMDPQVVAVIEPELEAQGGPINVGAEAAVPARTAKRIEADIERTVDWDVLHSDDPAKAIVERAADIDASLITISTHGRTGLARVVMGSVAMAVVHKAHCPVLVHRPLRLRT